MDVILALMGALAAASIPILVGWRRTQDEASMARAMGLSVRKNRIDPDKLARQTGTGLTFHQILFGFLVWVGGGFLLGFFLSSIAAIFFAIAGGAIYSGTLGTKRQEFRLSQAKDILRGLGVIQTLLEQGRTLEDSLAEAASSVGPAGKTVLGDLVVRMRSAPADQASQAIREWTTIWDNPASDMLGTALLAWAEARIGISELVGSLRSTLASVVEILARARAAASGVEWQAKFLALFPPGVLIFTSILSPEISNTFRHYPLYLAPTLLGSGLSFALTSRMIRNGLSIEASVGLNAGKRGEIRLDRMGRVI